MYQRTRKLMTMIHKALHSKDDVDWLYVSRKEEGSITSYHASIKDSTTQVFTRKTRGRNDYSKQKLHWQHEDQQNDNN